MAKKDIENQLSSSVNDLKEPSASVNAETPKTEQNFRVPDNTAYSIIQRFIRRRYRRSIISKTSDKEDKYKNKYKNKINIKSKYENKINMMKSKYENRLKRRFQKDSSVEIASDKNIATLLRSERLLEFIKKGYKIPYDIGRNISEKTGFKSVTHLNNYISAHRKKFIVLVDKKEKHCQSESRDCNGVFRRSDSVDLDLYFTHHFGDTVECSKS